MKLIRNFISYALKHKIRSVLVIAVLGITGSFMLPKNTPPIETVKVKKQKITQSITATGSVKSLATINLSFLTGGKVVYVGAKKGDEVTAGQTIAVLDQRTIQENLQQALIDYSKQRNIYETNQDANQDRKPQDALNEAMKRILETNQYDLDKAVNSVELQNLALQQTVLTTPINGIVTRADIEVAGLNATATTTYTVSDPNSLIFDVEVDEADIAKISLGQRMNVTFDAYPDHTIPLEVTRIDFSSHSSDTGGTVYSIEASMPENTDFRYRIGMHGDAEIIISEKGRALTIPISSIVDEKYVYVKKDKKFEKRRVRAGLESDTEIEIVSGLKEGEEIALQPEEVEKIQK